MTLFPILRLVAHVKRLTAEAKRLADIEAERLEMERFRFRLEFPPVRERRAVQFSVATPEQLNRQWKERTQPDELS